jgi:CheY-like chemotaxis protein
VDDDPIARKLAKTTLRQLGYRTLSVPDAESGLRAVAEQRPAAVILDLLMPGLDGFEFLRRFRASALGRSAPVIVWTGKDLTTKDLEVLRSSVAAVVLKSAGSAALIEELQACLPSSRGGSTAGR